MHFRKSVVGIVLMASVCVGIPSASAQNLVFAGSPEPGPNPRAVTPAGEAPLSLRPLQRNPDLLIVLDLDCLDPSDYDAAKRLLTAAQKIKADILTVRLGFIDKGVLGEIAGPFRSPGELQSALRKLKPAADPGACPPALDFFSRTAQSLAPIPSDWGYTLLNARLPQFDPAADPALAQYATAWLTREFIAQKRTLVFDDPTGAPSALAAAVSRATGSPPLNSSSLKPEDLLPAIAEGSPLMAVTWPLFPLSHGFDVELVSFRDFPARASLPTIAAAPASVLPTIAAYAEFRAAIGRAEAILSRPDADSAPARAELERALKVNPADRDAVRLSLKLAARDNNPAAEIPLLQVALELNPSDTPHWSRLGELQYLQKNFPAAERALLRARALGAASAKASEQLGRISLDRNDLPVALDFIADSVRLDATQQPLWFLAADTAGKLNRVDRQTEALERGLALGGNQLSRRTELIRIYLARNDALNAARHVDLELPRLPADAGTQTTWAHFYEQLNRPEDALNCWKRVIVADPSIEPAHYAVSSILWNAKRVTDALEASDEGLNAAPKSARIELVKIACLEQLDRIYAARRSLEAFARDTNDLAILKREAEFTDRLGGPAPDAWKRYAEALTAAAATDPARKAELGDVLRRGAVVAARDGDAGIRDWFEARSAPAAPARASRTAAPASGVWIAGGTDALGFMAGAQTGIQPDRFLVDFCRRIVSTAQSGPPALTALQKDLIAYFEALRQLFALSTRTGDRATITLSVSSRQGQDRTEKVLNLLGWKLVRSKQTLLVQSSEKKDQARNQDLASALAIDQSGMQAAFQKGTDFRIDLPFDRVPVLFDESTWRLSFRTDKLAGGLPEALVRTPDFARVYLALNNVDPATANVLFTNFGLNPKYAELLSSYSSALAVVNGRALVPGGVAAEPVWTRLAGAAPSDPARFFRALFDKDQGRLLIWFFQLSELDSAHQRFYTSSSQRIAAFYEAFSSSDDVSAHAGRLTRSNAFSDFLRSIPLDGNSVNFPGSPEVWMVATGHSVNAEQSGKLLKKARRVAAPEIEDEILLRLARLKDKAQNGGSSATSAFLAVARIDEHRLDPLDDQSALLLGQNFNEFQSFYPYFLEFRTLKASDFQTFFNFMGRMKVAEEGLADVTLGQFEALLELLRLARVAGAVPEGRGDDLFRHLCVKFATAQDAAGYSSASLDMLREILGTKALGTKATSKDPDAALAELLLPNAWPVEIDLGDSTVSLDVNHRRAISYGRVIDLQKVPRLAALLRLDDSARRLAQGTENPAPLVEAIVRDADELPLVEVPKTVKIEGHAKQSLQRASPAKLRQSAAELRQATVRKKPNQKDLQKLARDVLEELSPQVRIALTGVVYAVHFEATDILVENDPLLVRKHQSFDLVTTARPVRFPGARLQEGNSGEGSYFVGSFALLALESAVARVGLRSGGSGALMANQLATNRMTPWDRYSDSEQRLLGSKLRMAREWCVYAASDPAVFAALSEDTLGVLSLSRRRQLLNAVTERDGNGIAASLTLSDLLALADRYLARYAQAPWPSPVDADLRRASRGADSVLSLLGPLPATLYGCSHPHLAPLAPYEEYEHHLFPVEMAERSAEMKIYLAAAMDRAAIPAAAMAAIADDVTAKTFASMRMSDARDWTSALKAFGAIDGKTIRAAIEAANR